MWEYFVCQEFHFLNTVKTLKTNWKAYTQLKSSTTNYEATIQQKNSPSPKSWELWKTPHRLLLQNLKKYLKSRIKFHEQVMHFIEIGKYMDVCYFLHSFSTLIISRLRRFFHLDSGNKERVTSCSPSCSGETYSIISSHGSSSPDTSISCRNRYLLWTFILQINFLKNQPQHFCLFFSFWITNAY